MTARRSLSTRDRAAIFKAHAGLCHLCNGKITPGDAWDVSHEIPLELGGKDDASNMRPAQPRGYPCSLAAFQSAATRHT